MPRTLSPAAVRYSLPPALRSCRPVVFACDGVDVASTCLLLCTAGIPAAAVSSSSFTVWTTSDPAKVAAGLRGLCTSVALLRRGRQCRVSLQQPESASPGLLHVAVQSLVACSVVKLGWAVCGDCMLRWHAAVPSSADCVAVLVASVAVRVAVCGDESVIVTVGAEVQRLPVCQSGATESAGDVFALPSLLPVAPAPGAPGALTPLEQRNVELGFCYDPVHQIAEEASAAAHGTAGDGSSAVRVRLDERSHALLGRLLGVSALCPPPAGVTPAGLRLLRVQLSGSAAEAPLRRALRAAAAGAPCCGRPDEYGLGAATLEGDFGVGWAGDVDEAELAPSLVLPAAALVGLPVALRSASRDYGPGILDELVRGLVASVVVLVDWDDVDAVVRHVLRSAGMAGGGQEPSAAAAAAATAAAAVPRLVLLPLLQSFAASGGGSAADAWFRAPKAPLPLSSGVPSRTMQTLGKTPAAADLIAAPAFRSARAALLPPDASLGARSDAALLAVGFRSAGGLPLPQPAAPRASGASGNIFTRPKKRVAMGPRLADERPDGATSLVGSAVAGGAAAAAPVSLLAPAAGMPPRPLVPPVRRTVIDFDDISSDDDSDAGAPSSSAATAAAPRPLPLLASGHVGAAPLPPLDPGGDEDLLRARRAGARARGASSTLPAEVAARRTATLEAGGGSGGGQLHPMLAWLGGGGERRVGGGAAGTDCWAWGELVARAGWVGTLRPDLLPRHASEGAAFPTGGVSLCTCTLAPPQAVGAAPAPCGGGCIAFMLLEEGGGTAPPHPTPPLRRPYPSLLGAAAAAPAAALPPGGGASKGAPKPSAPAPAATVPSTNFGGGFFSFGSAPAPRPAAAAAASTAAARPAAAASTITAAASIAGSKRPFDEARGGSAAATAPPPVSLGGGFFSFAGSGGGPGGSSRPAPAPAAAAPAPPGPQAASASGSPEDAALAAVVVAAGASEAGLRGACEVKHLKAFLRLRGAKVGGAKPALVERALAILQASGGGAAAGRHPPLPAAPAIVAPAAAAAAFLPAAVPKPVGAPAAAAAAPPRRIVNFDSDSDDD